VRRTLVALRVTPMTVARALHRQGRRGVGLAFVQSVAYLAIVGALGSRRCCWRARSCWARCSWTAFGFLLASIGRDFFSIMGWGIIVMIVLVFPGFTVLFPGALSGWIKSIRRTGSWTSSTG